MVNWCKRLGVCMIGSPTPPTHSKINADFRAKNVLFLAKIHITVICWWGLICETHLTPCKMLSHLPLFWFSYPFVLSYFHFVQRLLHNASKLDHTIKAVTGSKSCFLGEGQPNRWKVLTSFKMFFFRDKCECTSQKMHKKSTGKTCDQCRLNQYS